MEEIGELKEEIDSGAQIEKVEGEFGDVLFSMINYARFVDVNPEDALRTDEQKVHQ